jgi:hypothetical protein
MYTHVSKCKNDKIKGEENKKKRRVLLLKTELYCGPENMEQLQLKKLGTPHTQYLGGKQERWLWGGKKVRLRPAEKSKQR